MGDIKVQRGVTVFGASADSTTATITAVGSTTKAFVRVTNVCRASGGDDAGITTNRNVDDLGINIALTNTTTVTISRLAAGVNADMRIAWEVWEYTGSGGGANEFIVRYANDITYTAGSANVDTAVSGITTLSKCVPFIAGQTAATGGSSVWDRASCTAEMVNVSGNKVRLVKAATSTTATVSVVVVEFTGSNWSVQSKTHSFSASGSTETETITAVSAWSKAFITYSFRNSPAGTDETTCNVWPGSTTSSVRFRMTSGATVTSAVCIVHVVAHSDLSVEHLDSITGGKSSHAAGSSSPQAIDETITTLSDTSAAGVIASHVADDSAATYPRSFWNFRIKSTTAVEFWRARHGASGNWALQVINFSSVGASGSVTANLPLGTIAVTGKVPTVTATAHKTSNLPLGTIAVTGQTPTITASDHKTTDLPLGTIAVAGQTPTVTATANKTADLPLGTISVTAQPLTVDTTAHKTSDLPLATITVQGIAPSVTAGANVDVDLPLGTITVAAQTPSVNTTTNQVSDLPLGTIAIAGQAPTVTTTASVTSDLPVAGILVAGLTPTIFVTDPKEVDLPLGTITVAGLAPSVTVSGASGQVSGLYLDLLTGRVMYLQPLGGS